MTYNYNYKEFLNKDDFGDIDHEIICIPNDK